MAPLSNSSSSGSNQPWPDACVQTTSNSFCCRATRPPTTSATDHTHTRSGHNTGVRISAGVSRRNRVVNTVPTMPMAAPSRLWPQNPSTLKCSSWLVL